jgi:hypothetical protein
MGIIPALIVFLIFQTAGLAHASFTIEDEK